MISQNYNNFDVRPEQATQPIGFLRHVDVVMKGERQPVEGKSEPFAAGAAEVLTAAVEYPADTRLVIAEVLHDPQIDLDGAFDQCIMIR